MSSVDEKLPDIPVEIGSALMDARANGIESSKA